MSPFKLKKIFYENDVLPIKNPIYSRYDGKIIDVIIIDDTKAKRRSGGRPSVKGAVGLNLKSSEKYLLFTGVTKSYSDVLSHIRESFRVSEMPYAVCDGDDKLQKHLLENGYHIQQCTNHFIKTSMYYLWQENYPLSDRKRIKKEVNRIISTLKNSVEKHKKDSDFVRLKWRINKTKEDLRAIIDELVLRNGESKTARFVVRTMVYVTTFAELAIKGITIPNTNNLVENLMGIIGQRVKGNHQSWTDDNLDVMLKTIWYILS